MASVEAVVDEASDVWMVHHGHHPRFVDEHLHQIGIRCTVAVQALDDHGLAVGISTAKHFAHGPNRQGCIGLVATHDGTDDVRHNSMMTTPRSSSSRRTGADGGGLAGMGSSTTGCS